MKRIYCDFCNKEINTAEETWLKNITNPASPPARDNIIARVCDARDVCYQCAREIKDFLDAFENAFAITSEYQRTREESLNLIEQTIESYIISWLERQDKKDWILTIAKKRKGFDFTARIIKYQQMVDKFGPQ